jgi:uncharacterized repeat protein (TIGR02543 family)
MSKTGYAFAGWYDNVELSGTAVTVIPAGSTGNKEFWAKWATVFIFITYNQNGGTGAISGTYATEDSEVTLPTAAEMSKTGYIFAGWYDNAELSGSAVTSIPANSTGTRAFWAAWAAVDYTITYHADGGTGAIDGTYNVESAAVTLPTALTMNKPSYAFVGWYDNAGLTGTAVTVIPAGSTGDKEYWAKWTFYIFITYHQNGGSGATDGTYANESAIILPTAAAMSKTGYTFAGWYDNEGLSGTAVTGIPAGSTGNREYWAAWTSYIFITYHQNGGAGATDGTYANESAITLPTAAVMSKNG